MKKNLIALSIVLCFSATTALAIPTYYTFEGVVTETEGTDNYIGDQITYVFLIDFEQSGESTKYNNEVTYKNDSASADYFYADLISGSVVEAQINQYMMGDEFIKETNYGFSVTTPGEERWALQGGSQWDGVRIAVDGQTIDSLTLNSVVSGVEMAYNNMNEDAATTVIVVRSSLTLTGMSTEHAPVPEPATIFLLGGGLAGLAFYRRKRK